MPIDASIPLGIKQPEFENPLNALAKVMQIKGMQQESQMGQMKMDEYQRSVDDQNALRTELSQPGADPYRALLNRGKIKEATEYQKGQNDSAKQKVDLIDAKLKQSRTFLDQVQTPEQFIEWHKANHADPVLGPELAARGVTAEQSMATIKQALSEPGGFQRLLQKSAMGLEKFTEANKPTTSVVNAGGTSQILQTPGLGGTPTLAGTVQHTVSPDAQLSANTSTANNKRTIEAENQRAGVVPGGGMDDNSERTAQAIASGQLPAPTGMALLNPKNQRILGRVMEINPQYDATTVSAKKAAATAFTTGKEGAMMRSLQVAGQHLEQLDQLIDGMNNGNMQLVNKISNTLSQQTGSPAITNFDAAKEVVAKEVMKAIVAGGGGVGEREELARSLANAKSPAQLKGVTQQYRNLMSAQHEALLQQRDAAGLSRSTLPNYTEPKPGGAAPGTPEMSAIDAELARRGHK